MDIYSTRNAFLVILSIHGCLNALLAIQNLISYGFSEMFLNTVLLIYLFVDIYLSLFAMLDKVVYIDNVDKFIYKYDTTLRNMSDLDALIFSIKHFTIIVIMHYDCWLRYKMTVCDIEKIFVLFIWIMVGLLILMLPCLSWDLINKLENKRYTIHGSITNPITMITDTDKEDYEEIFP